MKKKTSDNKVAGNIGKYEKTPEEDQVKNLSPSELAKIGKSIIKR
jgi:hypothetical protein